MIFLISFSFLDSFRRKLNNADKLSRKERKCFVLIYEERVPFVKIQHLKYTTLQALNIFQITFSFAKIVIITQITDENTIRNFL